MATTQVELRRMPPEAEITSNEIRFNEQNFGPSTESRSTPPADRGMAAWLFLVASFMIEALVWGFAFSFGIFQEYYTRAFPGEKNIAVIGTCCMGVIYLSSPVVFASLTKWPRSRRPAALAGLLTMCVALALASFSRTVPHLILTHGILYAIGGSLCYSPTILFLNEWFIVRKGLAFGIMWAGTGVSGVILPLVFQWLLAAYGFKTTLRIWSVALFILTFPLLHFLRPRLPLSSTPRPRQRFQLEFLRNRVFVVFQACNILESFGFFLPTIYLPTYATESLHTSQLVAAGTIILVNVASVFGCIGMGTLTDRFHVTTCCLISSIGATIGVLLFWGLSSSVPLLYVFCVIYGLFAGSFSSTWAAVITLIQEKSENADSGLVFAFLAFGRGIGNVVSGPLSAALVKGGPWVEHSGLAYGSGFGPLIVFTGVSAFLGGGSFFFRGLRNRA